jgi:hypothetical protein
MMPRLRRMETVVRCCDVGANEGYLQIDHHTMDTFVQAVTDEKREAQNKLGKMILPGIQRAAI